MRSSKTPFKSGYVAIAGKPNVGKSTLLNQILDRKLAIVSPKAQTTRHRILGILNNSRYQVIFWDTPGLIEPRYSLQDAMMIWHCHAASAMMPCCRCHDAMLSVP